MSTPDIIFYACKTSVFALRVEFAFQEAKADVKRYLIDLKNKPEWFASRVNPAGKVPALVYGSPKSDPENPSAESVKLAGSVVILEFVADLYPDSGLLPNDPVDRARVRFFIDAFSTKIVKSSANLFGFSTKIVKPATNLFYSGGDDEAPHEFIAAVAELQELLPHNAQFAVGDHFTIADAAFTPFLGLWELLLRNNISRFAAGTGPPLHQELFESERFARLQKYYANISSRESFKNSLDAEFVLARAKIVIAQQ